MILSPLQLYFQHDVVVQLKNKGLRAKRHTSELNAEHSHFILLDDITDLHEIMALRYKIEERLLTPIGRGKRYRKMINMSDPNLSMIIYSYYRHCIFIYLALFNLGIIKNFQKYDMKKYLFYHSFLLFTFMSKSRCFFVLTDMEDASAFLHNHSDIISSTSTPMVGLLIQGGPIDIEHVVDLLRKKVPVLVVKGSGLAADLVAFVFNEKLTQ